MKKSILHKREQLYELLGIEVALPDIRIDLMDEKKRAGYLQRELRIATDKRDIPTTLLVPDTPNGAGIVYCHAHGDRHDIGRKELTEGRPALLSPLGPVFAEAGYAVICADMPGFGDRQTEGNEGALAKAQLWHGGTLMGQMLTELRLSLDALISNAQVQNSRIGAFGISMGATHGYWLAALEPRIVAVAHLCAFSDIGPLIQSGAHDLHAHYMTIPGLLKWGDMGDVAAMVAPRPQLVARGAMDPLTPDHAFEPASGRLRKAYEMQKVDQLLTVIDEADAGHEETKKMRQAVFGFFEKNLRAN